MKFKNINTNKYIVNNAMPVIDDIKRYTDSINNNKMFLTVLTDGIVNKLVCRAVAEKFIETHVDVLDKYNFVTISIPECNGILISVGKAILEDKPVYLDGVLEI